tara:strand:- start:15 stop:644 length:630 start_codon:yes stop_codon:yes gene_type:complete
MSAVASAVRASKRTRDGAGADGARDPFIPADPLTKVPKRLEQLAEDAGFTVLDFVHVLAEMKRLLNFDFSFTGPAEGCIELRNCATRLWLSDRARSKTQYAGQRSELRFDFNIGNRDERLRFVQDFLHWPVLDGDDDATATEKILQVRLLTPPSRALTDEKKRWLLQQPMPLCLRESYPYWTWPRWVFGIFEGLVMQRILKKRAGGASK